jgi:hypothetical protein
VISRTKTARKTASLVVSLGVLVAVAASAITFSAARPNTAFGEVMPPSADAWATTTATAEATTTAETTAAAEATVTAETTAAIEAAAPLTPVMATPAVPPRRPVVVVPSVLGKTRAVAVRRLKARKLRVKVTRVYSSKRTGTVIGQTPVKKRRVVGSTVRLRVAKRWPNGFKSKARSDRFWRPYVVATYKQIDRSRRYRGRHRVYTSANVNMTLRAIWGESRGAPRAGLSHHDGYIGLLQLNRGYGSTKQRLDPIYSIRRMGRGIKLRGAWWARAQWSTI